MIAALTRAPLPLGAPARIQRPFLPPHDDRFTRDSKEIDHEAD
jgi:hypothetical protein